MAHRPLPARRRRTRPPPVALNLVRRPDPRPHHHTSRPAHPALRTPHPSTSPTDRRRPHRHDRRRVHTPAPRHPDRIHRMSLTLRRTLLWTTATLGPIRRRMGRRRTSELLRLLPRPRVHLDLDRRRLQRTPHPRRWNPEPRLRSRHCLRRTPAQRNRRHHRQPCHRTGMDRVLRSPPRLPPRPL